MKTLLLLPLILFVVACGDQITLVDIAQASAICEKNGGADKLRIDNNLRPYIRVTEVTCVDGASFSDSRLWEKKK